MQESERIFIAENATLLRGSERELNRQLFTILNSIYDGLYITDGQANTILINRAYEEVSGLRREDVLGKSMQEIVATGMIDRSGSLGVLKTRKPVTLEQTFRTGKQALITSTPHFDSSGEITMIITVVRDMTEIYGLQRKYQESEERRRSEMEFLQRNQRFVSRMVAADPRTLEVLARAQKVATLDTTVLLLGETGVGKEQFARYIYENSARARQSFIGINCGAIPASLIESGLFGYEKGAFTGASKEGKMGVFESADKGTVFLDEVGELSLAAQVRLLHVLEDGTVIEHSHDHAHGHHHTNTKAVLNRLSRAIGHMESIKRMVEEGRDCTEVLIQLSAVKAAINNTGKIILEDHIEHCIVDAVEHGDTKAIQELNKAIDRFVK